MLRLQIMELIVVGFKRLSLSPSKSFTINPKNIHLILGTNGSGKSSLLELMTPLPPNRKDFESDGFKSITFRYDDDIYNIHSQDNKNSVIKNGVSVYDNIGAKSLIEYCKDTFNITPLLHRFMLGKVNITTMSLQDRKEFITNISHIDYEYANSLYSKLKKKLRDEQAISRHLHNKILLINSKLMNEVDLNNWISEKEKITQTIYSLYENMTKMDKQDIDEVSLSRIVNKTKELLLSVTNDNTLSNVDSIKDKLAVIKNEKSILSKKKDELSNKLFELSKTFTNDELDKEMNDINVELSTLSTYNIIPNIDNEITRLSLTAVNLSSTINNLLEDMFNIKLYTITTLENMYNELISKKHKLNIELDSLREKINIIDIKIEEYSKISTSLTCTHCNTPIINDSIKTMLDMDKQKRAAHSSRIDAIKLSLSELLDNTLISDYDTLQSIKSRLNTLDLSKYIDDDSISNMYNKLDTINKQINARPRVLSLESRKKELLSLYANTDSNSGYKQLESEYDNINSKIDELSNIENILSTQLRTVDTLNSNILELSKYLKLKNKNRRVDINNEKNNIVLRVISDLKTSLNNINNDIANHEQALREEATLSKEVKDNEDNIRLLQLVIEELSPSTGLIADSIKSFLSNYINDVNNIINSVWSYKLEISPFDMNELEKGITYRFPVSTEGNDNSDDIINTSESMKDIISLAFRLTSLRYMGLAGYPILIDELDKAFDTPHRINLYDLLEEVSVENDVQMFIIAHIKEAYSRFNNAEISIVSDMNIELK